MRSSSGGEVPATVGWCSNQGWDIKKVRGAATRGTCLGCSVVAPRDCLHAASSPLHEVLVRYEVPASLSWCSDQGWDIKNVGGAAARHVCLGLLSLTSRPRQATAVYAVLGLCRQQHL
jgi:hypothetical protein